MQLANSSYSPAREADLGGHGICSLIGHFPVTLYADTAFSLRAKFCPLLKSLGSKLVRFLYIMTWISMCFLACHPCGHRVGKENLCCSLPCGKWAFLVVLVNHVISMHVPRVAKAGALSARDHFQGCRICRGTDVWSSVPAARRIPHLNICGEVHLLGVAGTWGSSPNITQNSQKECWMR